MTVSVVPLVDRQAVDGASEEESIRVASQQFCNLAADQGWTSESRGLFGLAQQLAKGRDNAAQNGPGYLERLRDDGVVEVPVHEKLLADVETAKVGLDTLTSRLEQKLAAEPETKPERADVTGYERALVHAHQSRQTFAEAVAEVSQSTPAARGDLETALAGYDGEIERARSAADALADRYAERRTVASQSVF